MIALERRRCIMEQLIQKKLISLKEIAKELNISEITVRRDFEKLEQEGRLKRVSGGAALNQQSVDADLYDTAELSMKERFILQKHEKDSVAKFAAQFVNDGDNVFLDAGTSMRPLMNILSQKKIKIVTYNQLLVCSLKKANAEIFIVGGQFSPLYSMNVGAIAQDVLKQFYFNKAFFSCSGIDLQQKIVYTTEMESLLMKKIALGNASSAYLLLDHTKMDKHGFLKFVSTDAFTKIICDKNDNTSFTDLPDNFHII